MAQVFGHRFTSQYGNKDDGSWYLVLQDLSPELLRYGFQKMLTQHRALTGECIWPPNALEFRRYCQYEWQDFGLPDVHRAFEEASTNSRLSQPHWSHTAVQLAWEWLEKPVGEALYLSDYDTFRKIYHNLCRYYVRQALQRIRYTVPITTETP